MDSLTLSLTLSAFLLLVYLANRFNAKHDPREPPLVAPKIPVVGHAIGLLRHGTSYYSEQSALHPDLPAYSINLIISKVYVINSPALVNTVQRQSRVLKFDSFVVSFTIRMLGFTGPGAELLREEEDGGKGLMLKVKHAMSPTLLGPGLDSMNEKMIKLLKSSVDELAARQNQPVDIFAWCRHAITTASTYASFGPLNPLADKKVEEALWTFEQNLIWVFVKIFPGKIIQARELLVCAFEEYFQAGGHEDSSDLTLARWKVQRDAGASVNDIARLEISECVAILTNTVPITFWMVFDIYSRPMLLREIRKELHEHALRFDGKKCTIDLTDIREKCALLLSTFQEVLRLRSKASPIRTGTKDVMLNDRYLIKAGSTLQMPGPFLGRKQETWGERAHEFDPSRFMKGNAENDKNSAKRVSSFLAFGTVPNMCPGRHFASGEVLAVVAMLVLMYDLTPENGEWREPRVSKMAMASSIDSPTRGFNVKVNEREEFRDTEWDFRVTPGKGRFGLITG